MLGQRCAPAILRAGDPGIDVFLRLDPASRGILPEGVEVDLGVLVGAADTSVESGRRGAS